MEWLDLFRLQRHLWECNENCSAHLYSGKEVHIRQCLACDSGFFVLKQNIAGLKTLYIQGCSAQQSTEQVQILVCEVDFCPEETLQKMCQKATDIFEAVRRPIYQDCFVNGEHDNKYCYKQRWKGHRYWSHFTLCQRHNSFLLTSNIHLDILYSW